MPVYLVHGFRWPRNSIRIHIILQNIDDAASEWLLTAGTQHALIDNLRGLYPDVIQDLPKLRFVEQYDPEDTTSADAKAQPYAYVCDVVYPIHLAVDVEDVRGQGVPNDQWAALMELRDKLAPGEKVAWYVVVCGDEERWAPPAASSDTRGSSPLNECREEIGSRDGNRSNQGSEQVGLVSFIIFMATHGKPNLNSLTP